MAKRIKFPLILKDDFQVRTLEELREHFDLEKIISYYQNQKLQIWLEDRYYEDEMNQLLALDDQSSDFITKLCQVLGVVNTESIQIDLSELAEKQKKRERLQQFTNDPTILNSLDQVAFNQEELADILDEEYDTIYLCENQYRIPTKLHNKHYIGLGNACILLHSAQNQDLKALNITFTNIALINEAKESIETISSEEAEHLYYSCQMTDAVPLLQKLTERGDDRARCILGKIYIDGVNYPADFDKGYALLQEGTNHGSALCKFWLAMHTKNGFENIYDTLENELRSTISPENAFDLYALSMFYLQNGDKRDLNLSFKYCSQSAYSGYWKAYRTLGIDHELGRGTPVDYHAAKNYYLKAAELGDYQSQIWLGELLLYKLDNPNEGLKWYRTGYTPTIMKNDIQKLINEIDNLEKQTVFKFFTDFSSLPKTDFGSKSDALNSLKNVIIRDCNKINSYFFCSSSEAVTKIKNAYKNEFHSIITTAQLYQRICNSPDPIADSDIQLLENTIYQQAENLIQNYNISYANSSYPLDSLLMDFGGFLNPERYHITYDQFSVFGSSYGLDYQKQLDDYLNQVYAIAKELLKPIKEILLTIDTEVLA